MARILIAWELGANAGHGVKLAAMARALRNLGHHIDFALQRLDAARSFRDLAEAPGVRLRQAPLWPGLMGKGGPVGAWGDVLAQAGMTDSGVLEYLLRGWESLLLDAAPDLILAEFAPAVQLAAQGRIPVAAFGTGYTVPQSKSEGFAPFDSRAVHDESALLRLVNHALSRLGRRPLQTFAEIAAADLHLPACFTELDPYASARDHAPLPPFIGGALPPPAPPTTDIFAYLPQPQPEAISALTLLSQTRTVAVHAPGLASAPGLRLVAAQPLTEIVKARVILGSGGHGLTSAALAMTRMQVLLPTDAEKRLNARAAQALGCALTLDAAPADAIATALEAALHRTPPPNTFAARLTIPPETLALPRLLTLLKS